MQIIPNSTKQTKPTMYFSRRRISRPIPTKNDRSFFCRFTTGAFSSVASAAFAGDF
jgi:hypothetical protein